MDYMYIVSSLFQSWFMLGTIAFVWLQNTPIPRENRVIIFLVYGPLIWGAMLTSEHNLQGSIFKILIHVSLSFILYIFCATMLITRF